MNFVNAEWEHIYFSNVHVNHIQLGGTVFDNIKRPDAQRSRLDEEPGTDGWVNVEPVVFRNSDLGGAVFDNCALNGVDIRGCRMDGMTIDGIPVAELLAAYAAAKSR
ncbi:pentapeptide repeat-containing protein [Paenibacillus glycinis]|uniref:pentapeptide repeat-containing protein n=1 Tax=Paenibacillus glycinis TaxID=2697035 RepID=UPI00191C2CB9|nr:pentapeptide repeat-containing protein [Paenibacillus glycinis]